MITPQIAYRVTAYRVDSAYRVGFTWNQIILGIYIVRTDLILGRYSVAYRVDWKTEMTFSELNDSPLSGWLIGINLRVTNNLVWEREGEKSIDNFQHDLSFLTFPIHTYSSTGHRPSSSSIALRVLGVFFVSFCGIWSKIVYIFNADKSGIQFRLLPRKTLAHKTERELNTWWSKFKFCSPIQWMERKCPHMS